MKNKYLYRSRISEKKFREILKLFCVDIEAKKVNDLIRVLIALKCEEESPFDKGEIEIDESYFGASGKTPVFDMLKRNGNVYTQVIKTCKVTDIMPIIEQKDSKESILYTEGFKTSDVSKANEEGYNVELLAGEEVAKFIIENAPHLIF